MHVGGVRGHRHGAVGDGEEHLGAAAAQLVEHLVASLLRADELESVVARAERLGNRIAISVIAAAVIDAVAQLGAADRIHVRGVPRPARLGAAGMVAAYELRKRGYSCLILEARSRAGGRCWTVRKGTVETEEGGERQECTFDEGLYFNPGPARIPHHHHAVLGYCREFGVALEVLVNENYATYYYYEDRNGPVGSLSGQRVPRRAVHADLRGYEYLQFVGNNTFYANAELRFPLIEAMLTPIGVMGGIRGVFFANMGGGHFDGQNFTFMTNKSTTYTPIVGYNVNNFTGVQTPIYGDPKTIDGFRLVDARGSYGIGLQTFALGFPVHFDWSWRTLFNKDWEDALFAASGGSHEFRTEGTVPESRTSRP